MKLNDPRVFEKKGKIYIRSPKQLIQLSRGVCSVCGEECYFRKYNASSPQKYCSVECRGRADKGAGNPNWKGGRSMHVGGYVRVYDTENITGRSRGRIFEHTLVMEKHLGRPLTKEETVHHKNGDRADNRLENLELFASRHPKGQRVTELVEYAKEILALYGHLV